MKPFTWFQPTEILFGSGRVAEIGRIAARFGKRCLLVTTPPVAETEAQFARVRELLTREGVSVTHFSGVRPNPTTDQVGAGARLAKEAGVDIVLGLGGGSSMDAAKAIAVEATHEGTCWDYLFFKKAPSANTLPIIAVTTTSGTGSQTTPCAVITKGDEKDKYVETLARTALQLIVMYLPRALENGSDLEARQVMAWADTLGGLSIASAGVTLPHGLGMQIGGRCPHVAHGQALAALYPEFTRFTFERAVQKFAVIARILNPRWEKASESRAAEKCCEEIDAFLKRIGMWCSLRSLEVPEAEVRIIADRGQVLPDCKNNPRVATIEEMQAIMKASYDRRV